MQLSLAFVELPDLPPTNFPPTPWDQIDEAARMAALEILACLIARMLTVEGAKEANDE
jgi:hypothetical protein